MKCPVVSVAAFCLAVLCCVADAQFTPQWNVGDWWIVNEQGESTRDDSGWVWQPRRYDVLDTEGVDGHDCYVLQEKLVDTTAAQEGVRDLYYVRTDDWKIVRRVEYFTRAGKLIGPSAADYPQGMFGTRRGELRMPVFPLDTTYVQDSAFGVYEFPIGSAYLRQFSGLADSVLLSLYLSQPDTSGGYPVQLGDGVLYAVLSEGGAPEDSSIVPYDYSLQLWSTDYPWRLYEEAGKYEPGTGVREPYSRSWLIGCGN